MRHLKRFVIHQVKDRVPQRVREKEELIVETAQDVLSKAKLLAWAAKERERCPICAKKYTLEEVYEKWESDLDNSLCDKHKDALDIMAFKKEEKPWWEETEELSNWFADRTEHEH